MKPSLFIGSSSESLSLARAVQAELSDTVDATIWSQGIFELSRGTLESLVEAANNHDYATFVLAPDDFRIMREQPSHVARDNVIFELGLFFGALGQHRCFFLLPSGTGDFKLPTDLAGITGATYHPGSHAGNIQASVGAACNSIRLAIQSHTGGSASLAGKWKHNWIVEIEGERKENPSIAEVKQVGNSIIASASSLGRTYIMRGTIERGNIITGSWQDAEAGPTYFGAGQLVVSPLKNSMRGKWVGWSQYGFVREGDWIWERISEGKDVLHMPNS